MRITKLLYNKYRNLRSKVVICHFKNIYGSKFKAGTNLYVRKGFTVTIEEGGEISIGKDVFFNNFCSLNALQQIQIGDNCVFGENVHVYDHNHKYRDKNVPVNNQGFTTGRVIIGNNTWIGSNVIILKGVTIGEHCVIGSGCVIFDDVEADSVVKNEQNLVRTNMVLQR